jgi:hypothetical protein
LEHVVGGKLRPSWGMAEGAFAVTKERNAPRRDGRVGSAQLRFHDGTSFGGKRMTGLCDPRLHYTLAVAIPLAIAGCTFFGTRHVSHRSVPYNTVPDIKSAFNARYKLHLKEDEGDRAMAYLERVIDRQINKIRGVLSFDAIVLALISLELRRVSGTGALSIAETFLICGLLASGALVMMACLRCLAMFRVEVEQPDNFASFSSEVNSSMDLIVSRLIPLDHAVRLSWWSVVYVTALIACYETLPHLT